MANANAKKTYIWLKMLKEWGGFQVGDIVRFGTSKGEARIANGEGVEVEKQKAVNGPGRDEPEPKKRGRPKIETATLKPEKETAEVTPEVKSVKTKKKVDAKKGG